MPDITAVEIRGEAELWVGPCPSETPVRATVVIPVYCGDATLYRAARSALDQTLRDIEVILVDDASTDGSWQVIKDLLRQDNRVRALRHRRNRGKSVAMNRAMALARGEWLAVLDADDWYHSDRLEALVTLAEGRNADLAADNQFLYDAAADRVVGTAWPTGQAVWRLSFDDFLLGSDAYESFNLGMLKPVLRVAFMRDMRLCYEENARQGEDFFHLLQFYLAGGRAVVSDNPTYFYTQPFGAISRQWSHAGRTRYDFQNAYDINRRYLTEAEHILSRRQREKLVARHDRLKSLETYFSAKDAFSHRRWFDALTQLAGHPAAIGYLLRRIYGRVLPRVSSKPIQRIAARARRSVSGDSNA